MNNDKITTAHLIYGYFDEDNKFCYIGLTKRLKRRHRDHQRELRNNPGKYDSVMTYFKGINKQLPDPVVLESGLTPKEAQEKEEYYIEYYKSNGYSIINIAKAGSLGSPEPYWTYEKCLEESKKYKKLSEFEKYSVGAYTSALKNGWLSDCTWLERRFEWSYDTCFEEAKKYTTRKEFHNNARGAHRVAMKNGWMDDYTWFKKLNSGHGFWNSEENCMNEAKKYKSKSQFINGSPGAYASALRHGWVDNYTWSEKRDKWNEETCLEEARKYQSLKDFYENFSGAYKIASKNGWLDSYTWLKRRFEWTDETALDEAKKYNSKSEFIKEKPGAYEYAMRHKLPLDKIYTIKENLNTK